MISSKAAALIKVREDGLALDNCSPDLQNDLEVVLAAVSHRGGALK